MNGAGANDNANGAGANGDANGAGANVNGNGASANGDANEMEFGVMVSKANYFGIFIMFLRRIQGFQSKIGVLNVSLWFL